MSLKTGFRWLSFSAATAAALALAVGPFPSLPAQAAGGFTNPQLATSTAWLKAHAKDVVIVDARPAEAYAKGHLPTAVSLPVSESFDPAQKKNFPDTQAKLEALFGSHGISNGKPVVVYDNGKETMAPRLFWTLEYTGHQHASVLDGGITAWTAEGGPVSTAPYAAPAAKYSAKIDPAKMPTRASCTAAQGNPHMAVLDARSPEEFRGDDVRAKRGGHIPGAINIEWKANFDGTRLKSAAALTQMYAGAGITRDKEIIAHCQTGQRSSVSYWALRLLGYPKVGNYAGSWVEWGNDPNAKIVTGG